jgi:hypothetical protein
MAGTRSSARNAGNSSSPTKKDGIAAGSKRKPEAEPSPKRSSKATKKQTTLEESGITKDEDSEMKDANTSDHGEDKEQIEPKETEEQAEAKSDDDANMDTSNGRDATDSPAKVDTDNKDAKEAGDDSAVKTDAANGDGAIEDSSQREKQVPSNILEKGLIYFFTRNRVGIDDADSVGDLQRTFFVLRPLPIGSKLGDGAIPDLKNNRLFALPKKTFPKSHNDRFMAFVEKANTSIQDLKDNFCKSISVHCTSSGVFITTMYMSQTLTNLKFKAASTRPRHKALGMLILSHLSPRACTQLLALRTELPIWCTLQLSHPTWAKYKKISASKIRAAS